MTDSNIFPQLEIPNTLAAGPGPGNTDARVLACLLYPSPSPRDLCESRMPSPA